MIVTDLDSGRCAVVPDKTYPPLIIDPDTPLPLTITRQFFKTVLRGHEEVINRAGIVEHPQFTPCNQLYVLWKSSGKLPIEDFLRLTIIE